MPFPRLAPWVLATLALGFTPFSTLAKEPPAHLRWLRYEAPEFPPVLASSLVRDGFAVIAFTFDDSGQLTDRLVLSASHPAFASAVLEAAAAWQLDPAELAPDHRRDTARFDFVRRGSVVSLTQRDAMKSAFTPYLDEAAVALATCAESDLDAALKSKSPPRPVYPPDLKARAVGGYATISFVVDGTGRVRVPVVAVATHPEFGVAALAALRPTNFVPPQRNGLPIQAAAERTFVFRLTPGS